MLMPSQAPLMVTRNVILFPQAMLPLHIAEKQHRKMVADTLAGDRMICVAMQRPGTKRPVPCPVAGLGLIRAAVEGADGSYNLILLGMCRVELGWSIRYRPYRISEIRPIAPATASSSTVVQGLTAKLIEVVGERLELGFDPPFKAPVQETQPGDAVEEPYAVRAFRQVVTNLAELDDPEKLVDLVSSTLLPDPMQRQLILETRSLEVRLRYVTASLIAEIKAQKNKPGSSHD